MTSSVKQNVTAKIISLTAENKDRLAPIPRRIPEAEILLCEKAPLQVTVDFHPYDLQEGDMLLIFPNQIRAYRMGEGSAVAAFRCDPESNSEYDRLLCSKPCKSVVPSARNLPVVSHIWDCLSAGSDATDEVTIAMGQGYFYMLFSTLLQQLQAGCNETFSDSAASVLDYCDTHFKEPLSLEIVGDALHLNRYYVSHLFSEKIGCSFNDYVNARRVRNACSLLAIPSLSVAEVGIESGFPTPRTLNRAFQKVAGMTPLEYRKSIK